MSTGLAGRLREMSASSRPEISTWPSSVTVGLDADLRRGLVVEAGEGHPVGVGPDQQAGQDRHARPDRQAAGGPLHGLGQDVTLESDLHAASLRPPVVRRAASTWYVARPIVREPLDGRRPPPRLAQPSSAASRRAAARAGLGGGHHLVLERAERSMPAGIAPVNTGRTSKTRSSRLVPVDRCRGADSSASPASRLYSLTRPRQPGLSMRAALPACRPPGRRGPSRGAAAGACGVRRPG